MAALHPDLRKQFEKKIVDARNIATEGATAALKRMGVADRDPPGHLSAEQKSLRVKLRAKARQIGDPFAAKERTFSSLTKITHEVAYEHWHRMLFARFLAENHLLIHPDMKVAVTLQECKDLAVEESQKTGGKPDAWLIAARFASRMLPQIFRQDDPVLALSLAPEHQLKLERLLEEVPADVFTADDSLGWVYQFWQREEKDRVNRAGDKITGDTLPAVTQLFTEHYMVLFLLHNTIGVWHAGKVLAANPKLAKDAKDEDELRRAVALDGYTFDYLRFVRTDDGKGPWTPAAGTFVEWPKKAAELKMLDPCCGSGHFLIAGFELVVRLRMVEENLPLGDAVEAVLRDNLNGLEIDARCTQIAAFNLALAAWKLTGYRILPSLHIACTGIAPESSEEEWLEIADVEGKQIRGLGREPIRNGLRNLHRLFSQAPTLGSLLDPNELPSDLIVADYETIQPFLASALADDASDENAHERAVAAAGMATAADLLTRDYTLVITNVPYLGRKSHGPILKGFIDDNYVEARKDLATVFVDRSFRWLVKGGTIAVVTRENWLFLTGYRKLRARLLKDQTWNAVARLGPGAFETIGGHVVKTAMVLLSAERPTDASQIAGFEASGASTPRLKAAVLRGENVALIEADAATYRDGELPGDDADLREDGDGDEGDDADGADEPAGPADGLVRGLRQSQQLSNPDARIILDERAAHEPLSKYANSWQGIKTSDDPRFTQQFWEQCKVGEGWWLYQRTPDAGADYSGRSEIIFWEDGYGKLTEVCQKGASFRGQSGWDRDGVAVHTMGNLTAVLYTGERFSADVSIVDPKDQSHLAAVYAYVSSEGYASEVRKIDRALRVTNTALVQVPFDFSYWSDVAAKKFPNGVPEPESDLPTQWVFHGFPAESDAPLQTATARLLGYRWPAEEDEGMRLSARARTLVARAEKLAAHTDDDGVVPIPVVGKESPGAERLRALLAAAYGKDWSPAKLHQLLSDPAVDWAEKGLEDWLRNGFFDQHCAQFQQRPFVWQIWDGRKDGFSVLVNYHELADGKSGAKLLEKIIYTYLGDWITRQEEGARKSTPVPGADLRLAAAKGLQTKLIAIAEGEPPFDIFVRWKSLAQQPIGWEPDLNDGVRMNIRPFVEAGVLRKNPNINWKKDRGKDPESAPWFKKFKGERINDHHLTLEEKRAAREKAQAKGK